MTINELCTAAHSDAKAKGWYDDGERNFGELLMLVVSELAECLEAHRSGAKLNSYDLELFHAYYDNGESRAKSFFEESIKNCVEDELADAVIRIADLCGYMGIDLESHIIAKMKYNRTRPRKHGKEY